MSRDHSLTHIQEVTLLKFFPPMTRQNDIAGAILVRSKAATDLCCLTKVDISDEIFFKSINYLKQINPQNENIIKQIVVFYNTVFN